MPDRKAPTKHQQSHAWESADKIRGKNPEVYRQDAYGNTMYRASQGKRTEMGWEMDHKHPLAKGGTNHTRNWQALQWEENRKKGGRYQHGYECSR